MQVRQQGEWEDPLRAEGPMNPGAAPLGPFMR